MKSETVIEVVNKLIGRIDPFGDTAVDDVREEHIKEYIKVATELINHLCMISENKDSYMYSVKNIGDLAFDAIKDIKMTIEDYMEEFEEKNNEEG